MCELWTAAARIPYEPIRNFCGEIGVTKYNGLTGMVVQESALRHDLNLRAERRMAVLRPIEEVIETYGKTTEAACGGV